MGMERKGDKGMQINRRGASKNRGGRDWALQSGPGFNDTIGLQIYRVIISSTA